LDLNKWKVYFLGLSPLMLLVKLPMVSLDNKSNNFF